MPSQRGGEVHKVIVQPSTRTGVSHVRRSVWISLKLIRSGVRRPPSQPADPPPAMAEKNPDKQSSQKALPAVLDEDTEVS